MKKIILHSLFLIDIIVSVYLVFIFVKFNFEFEKFNLFGFSFLIMFVCTLTLLFIMLKQKIISKLINYVLIITAFLNLICFVIYIFPLINYLFWVLGSSGE